VETDAKPNLLSWSRIRMWRDCHCKYHLYAIGTPQEPVSGFQHGIALHEKVEAYVGWCNDAGVSQDYDAADNMAEGVTSKRLQKAIRQFPVTITIRPDLVPAGLETAFELAIWPDRWLFRGRMDRVEIEPDGRVRIIDYKSGFKPQYPKDPDPQLLIYAACWQRLHPEAQKFELRQVWPEANYQLSSPTWQVEGPLSLEPVMQAIKEIEAAMFLAGDNPDSSVWEARASQKACSFCPYLTTACPLKPEVITTDEEATVAWVRSARLLTAVKVYCEDHEVEGLPGWTAPKSVNEAHFAPQGASRSKENAANRTEMIRKIFVHAAAGEVKLSSALKVDGSWLNREFAKETPLAADLKPYVYQVPPKAVFREETE
jgi:hypothetical protein